MTEKENITLQPHDTCYFHNESFEDYLSMENYNKKLRLEKFHLLPTSCNGNLIEIVQF